MTLSLMPIGRGGAVAVDVAALSDFARAIVAQTATLYDDLGYVPPWLGYLAVDGATPVGSCGFKGPPVAGRVEIAYVTFPEHEGRGHASGMAAALVALASGHAPELVVTAQTLAPRNASHRILEKTGFRPVRTLEDPTDGPLLEWELARA